LGDGEAQRTREPIAPKKSKPLRGHDKHSCSRQPARNRTKLEAARSSQLAGRGFRVRRPHPTSSAQDRQCCKPMLFRQ
jgi:hypothetical protein